MNRDFKPIDDVTTIQSSRHKNVQVYTLYTYVDNQSCQWDTSDKIVNIPVLMKVLPYLTFLDHHRRPIHTAALCTVCYWASTHS